MDVSAARRFQEVDSWVLQQALARPRVDYRNRKILKMRCVSCCELRVRSKHYAGNHCVAQFTWTSLLMTHRHQIPSLLRGSCIERSYSILDLFDKDSLECLKQGRASLPNRQNMQSVTNFKDRDGGCPNGCARLLVEPVDNAGVRRVPHERRQNVGIENDHRSKRAGLVWYPRSSGMSSSSPILANSEAISVPRPPAGASCSLTAFRRMSRTSSSMLRPCRAARRCSRTLTSFSIFRTTNWATSPPSHTIS